MNEPGVTSDAMAGDDLQRFLEVIRLSKTPFDAERRTFFDRTSRVAYARAPGRLDLMGGIADYSGSLVLQWPIREAACAAVQLVEGRSRTLEIMSLPSEAGSRPRTFILSDDDYLELIHAEPATLLTRFAREPHNHWAAYVAGPIAVLIHENPELRAVSAGGLRILVRSSVPEGKGVSSSAAVEVATITAVAGLLGISLGGIDTARMCQLAENSVVGAPCGIMDQMTSALGQPHRLLALLCQPALVEGFLDVPEELAVWGIDSGIRHAVTGADYTSVRIAAFMGYRILCDQAGYVPSFVEPQGLVRFDPPPWNGYLANLDRDEYLTSLHGLLPKSLSGGEFVDRYQGTTDPVTRIDRDRVYAVRACTAHPVLEHARVRRFAEILRAGASSESERRELGALMFASHASYSDCGLGSAGTDHLVELVREAGPSAGLYGAKITGGGSGGTVAILGRAEAADTVESIAARYREQSGHRVTIFSGSSSGACVTGYRIVDPRAW